MNFQSKDAEIGLSRGWCRLSCLLYLLSSSVGAAEDNLVRYDLNGNQVLQSAAAASLPTILTQPKRLLLQDLGDIAFSIIVEGSSPIAYQWFIDGVAIPGAVFDTLIVHNPSLNQQYYGQYRVVISNPQGSVTSRAVSIDPDTDFDGLGDRWELAYFGDLSQNGSFDTDGDGISNLEEFQNGNIPVSGLPAQADTLHSVVALGDFVTLTLNSIPGMTYQLQSSDELTNASWTNIENSVPGEGGILELRTKLLGTRQFYRVLISGQP